MERNYSYLELDYKINSHYINTNKKLGLYGLLGILQDVAGEHALRLGFGYEDSKKKGFFWVLVRQKLRINRWPDWNDLVTIKTWTKDIIGIYAIREYEIFVNDQKIGDCSTTWMILDSQTRRPKKIDNLDNLFKPRLEKTLEYNAQKVSIPKEIDSERRLKVQISDLDMNNHVSNIKYAEWILNLIPFSYHKEYVIKEYEINFSNEILLGEKIELFSNMKNISPSNNSELFFKGDRVEDSKTVFAARLIAEKLNI